MTKSEGKIAEGVSPKVKERLAKIAADNLRRRVEKLHDFIYDQIEKHRGHARFGRVSFRDEELDQLSRMFGIRRCGRDLIFTRQQLTLSEVHGDQHVAGGKAA